MSDVGSGEPGDVRMAGFAERTGIRCVDEVLDADRTVESEGHPVAGDAGGHHAIEHVNAAAYHFQNLWRCAQAHGVARLVGGQERNCVVDGSEHLLLRFADGDAADGIAVEIEFYQLPGGTFAEIGIDGALDDSEVMLGLSGGLRIFRGNPVLATFCPASGEGEGFFRVFFIAGVGRAFVEKHCDVRSECGLDLHGKLRGEHHG